MERRWEWWDGIGGDGKVNWRRRLSVGEYTGRGNFGGGEDTAGEVAVVGWIIGRGKKERWKGMIIEMEKEYSSIYIASSRKLLRGAPNSNADKKERVSIDYRLECVWKCPMYWRFSAKAGPPQNKRSSALTLTPPINAYMPQNWPLGKDSEGVKVKVVLMHNYTWECFFTFLQTRNPQLVHLVLNALEVKFELICSIFTGVAGLSKF